MWRPILEVVIGVLTAGCAYPYVRDILRGRTRPQRMSWLVFASLSAAATVAQFAEHGATSAVFLTGGATVGFGIVAVLSIRHGVGGTGRADVAAIVGLAAVLAIWVVTDNERLVVLLVIVIEIPAIVATVLKSLRLPGTETRSTWLIDGLAGCLALGATESLTFDLVVYPVYHAVANLSVVAAISAGRRRA